MDAIAITCDQTNSGPYAICLDNLMNGDTLIQDFESANVGAQGVLFAQPSFSGTTSPFLLSQTPGTFSPNVSMVTNITADNSANSLFVSWQFKDTATFDWLRLVAQGSGTPNPIVDLRLPISFRVLVLPVGSTPALTAPMIITQPQGGEVVQNGFVTLRVVASGSGEVRFGTDGFGYSKVFALDSNNGIIALTLGGKLTYTVSGTLLTLHWNGPHILQATPDLSLPFMEVLGAMNGYTVDMADPGQLFYRLKD